MLEDLRPDGRVLLTDGRFRIGMAHRDVRTRTERDLSWLDVSVLGDLSPDGRTLLFSQTGSGGRGGMYTLYARDADGSPAVRLGDGVAMGLSPDGRWALCFRRQPSKGIVLLPTRAGEPRVVPSDIENASWAAWFPDGKRILIAGSSGGKRPRLWVQDISRPTATPVAEEGVTAPAAISPDGALVAARDSTMTLVLYPADGAGAPRRFAGQVGNELPVLWSADGKAIFLLRRGGWPARVFRLDVATGRTEPWKEIEPVDPAGLVYIAPLHLTPDARSFAYSYGRVLSDLYLVDDVR